MTEVTKVETDFLREVEAFPGKSPVTVDLRKGAPFGWWPAATLGLIALVDRADSAVVGGALKDLQDDFGFSDSLAGVLLSASSLAALILVVPAGRAADTRNRKLLISAVMVTWGFLTFGAAAAPTFALFFLARVLLGMATPLTIPASASLAGDLYTTAARTKAFAILRVMEYLGFPLGLLIGGVASQIWGWRAAFLIMGVPAIVLGTLVAIAFREPRRGVADELTLMAAAAGVSPTVVKDAENPVAVATLDEPAELASLRDVNKMSMRKSMADVLGIRTLRAVILGQALLFAGFTGLFTWATIYFQRLYDLDAGPAAGITGGVGLMGLLVGGAVASRIGNIGGGRRPGWLITVGGTCLLIAGIGVLGFSFIKILPVQIVLFFFINAFNIIALANIGAATTNVIPATKRGTGFAVAQFLTTIGASTGALIVGVTSDAVIKSLGEGTTEANQAIGLSFGIGALTIALVTGAFVILSARKTYEADAANAFAVVNMTPAAP